MAKTLKIIGTAIVALGTIVSGIAGAVETKDLIEANKKTEDAE